MYPNNITQRKILFLLIICSLMVCGCTSISEKDKTSTEISNVDSSTLYKFTDKEIEAAKKVAETYYNNTNYYSNIKSIEYNLNASIYNEHSSSYKKGNLITFSVYTKDGENPPREIALSRESENSNWKVINEGY